MIRIEKINKRFKKLHALNGINAHFNKGQVISLIGPNGSGKTTLIKSILGLVKPDSGQIFFNDELISETVEYRKNIGYMPQIGRYPDNMKIGQLFKMIKNIRSEKEWDEELYFRFKLDTIPDKSMKALSGGTRQKVSAALAFLFNPDVMYMQDGNIMFEKSMAELRMETGEEKLGKAVAWMMKHGLQKQEVSYLRI